MSGPYVCKFKGFDCITFEVSLRKVFVPIHVSVPTKLNLRHLRSQDGKPSLDNNPLCPAQLCPNHFTNDLTRRRLQPPAIAARQVDTAALRRRAMAARPSRGGSLRRLARDEQ